MPSPFSFEERAMENQEMLYAILKEHQCEYISCICQAIANSNMGDEQCGQVLRLYMASLTDEDWDGEAF